MKDLIEAFHEEADRLLAQQRRTYSATGLLKVFKNLNLLDSHVVIEIERAFTDDHTFAITLNGKHFIL